MSLAGLAQGAALNLAARVAAMALALAVLVVVARMGPAVQGAFALFVAVESVLLTLGSGFGIALARRLSHHGDDAAAPLRVALRAATLAGVVAALVLAVVAVALPRAPYRDLWLLALAAPLLLWVPTASGLWLGRAQMGRLNAPQVAQPLLMLAALALALVATLAEGDALRAVLVAWLLARVLVALATAALALREAPGGAATAAAEAPGGVDWRFVAAVGLTNVVTVLNYRVPLFVVEREAGLEATGAYSVAVQLAELLWLLSSALSISAYRRIGEPGRDRAARTALQAARVGVLAALVAAPLLWALAAWAVPRVLGAGYEGVATPLALLLPGVVAYAAASAVSAYFTNQLGRPGWAGRVAALSLVLNTLGCLWAVPRYGAAGAAASTSLSYLLAIAAAWAVFLRAAGLPPNALWSAARRQSPP
jgi:O-antigen/teichoic acid export membrane protein